jgi:hypothetical protein
MEQPNNLANKGTTRTAEQLTAWQPEQHNQHNNGAIRQREVEQRNSRQQTMEQHNNLQQEQPEQWNRNNRTAELYKQ